MAVTGSIAPGSRWPRPCLNSCTHENAGLLLFSCLDNSRAVPHITPCTGSPHKVAVERDAQEEEQTPVEQQLVGACLRALVARNDPAARSVWYTGFRE